MIGNSSPLSLLIVLNPGGSSHIEADSKPAKTIDQMIALMSERGLVITDETEPRRVLFDTRKPPGGGSQVYRRG